MDPTVRRTKIMTYTSTIIDSSSLITQAVQRIDPAPQQHAATASLSQAKAEHLAIPQTDRADLSPASVLISQALSLSDVRSDKVASLRQAINAGTYKVPTADLAQKLAHALQG